MTESDFADHLNSGGISFRDIWNSNNCIYIGLPVLGYPRVARSLGKIILGDIAHAVYSVYKQNINKTNPIGIYIDELSSVITDEFIELLNKSRGAKVELTVAFQSPSDINKISPSLCQQILENASNWFVFKQRMEVGSNTFAEAIGTILGQKKTIKVKNGEVQDVGSQRDVHELIVHHDIIKNLNRGQAVVLQHSPSKIDLVNIKYIDPMVVKQNQRYLEDDGAIEILPSNEEENINEQDSIL